MRNQWTACPQVTAFVERRDGERRREDKARWKMGFAEGLTIGLGLFVAGVIFGMFGR